MIYNGPRNLNFFSRRDYYYFFYERFADFDFFYSEGDQGPAYNIFVWAIRGFWFFFWGRSGAPRIIFLYERSADFDFFLREIRSPAYNIFCMSGRLFWFLFFSCVVVGEKRWPAAAHKIYKIEFRFIQLILNTLVPKIWSHYRMFLRPSIKHINLHKFGIIKLRFDLAVLSAI